MLQKMEFFNLINSGIGAIEHALQRLGLKGLGLGLRGEGGGVIKTLHNLRRLYHRTDVGIEKNLV